MPLPALLPIALSLAAEFAPGLIRSLAGDKAGEVAEDVVNTASMITGVGDPADALAELQANAGLAHEFRMKMAEYEVELERLHQADRQSARTLTSDLAKSGSPLQWSSTVVSTVVTIGFFSILALLFTEEIPESSRPIAYILVGTLGGGFTQVLNFWLGSSKGSKDKDQIVAVLSKAKEE